MSEAKKKHRYRHSAGKRWIEVRVKNAQQLFDARDPAPSIVSATLTMILLSASYLLNWFCLIGTSYLKN